MSLPVCTCIYTLEIRNFKEGNFHRREGTALNNVGSNVGKHGNVIRRATLQTNRKVANIELCHGIRNYSALQRVLLAQGYKVLREKTPPPSVATNFQTNALKNLTHSLSSPFLINSIAFDSRIKIKKLQFQTGLKIFLTSSETQRSITYRIYSSNSYCTLIAREISSNRNPFPLLSPVSRKPKQTMTL